jgi:hypothetical protein
MTLQGRNPPAINSIKGQINMAKATSTTSPIDTLQINGVDYVRADSVPAASPEIGPTQIVVADKGFVFVGNVEDHADGSVTIRNCRNIRYWGTTKGLGELAVGPTSKTIVDPYGTVKLTPILRIAVVSGW